MKKDKKNEELQSRRQFFKKAAKGALPILGAIALSQMPVIGQASNSSYHCGYCQYGCTDCVGGCMDKCARSCSACSFGCAHNCKSSSK